MSLHPDIYHTVAQFLTPYELWEQRVMDKMAFRRWSGVSKAYLASTDALIDAASNGDVDLLLEYAKAKETGNGEAGRWMYNFMRSGYINAEANGRGTSTFDVIQDKPLYSMFAVMPKIIDIIVAEGAASDPLIVAARNGIDNAFYKSSSARLSNFALALVSLTNGGDAQYMATEFPGKIFITYITSKLKYDIDLLQSFVRTVRNDKSFIPIIKNVFDAFDVTYTDNDF